MTQEENAKAYTELINRLEDVKNAIKKQNYGIAMDILCKPYPEFQITISTELKESKEDGIRQLLIRFVKYDMPDNYSDDFSKEDCLDWFEKQGEHANFRNKIQIGDKVTRNEDGVLVNLSQLNRVAKKQGEQKPAKFDDTNAKRMFIKALECVEEQNAKGYKLTDCDKNSWWEDFKAFCSEQNLSNSAKTCKDEQDAAWSEKYIADVFEKVGLAKIVREQSNDALTNAIQDAMIELSKFLPQQNLAEEYNITGIGSKNAQGKLGEMIKNLKPVNKVLEQGSVWSEEDEENFKGVMDALNFCNHEGVNPYDIDPLYLVSWLKSLKERYTWKPSDEQIVCLHDAVARYNREGFSAATLTNLLEQLEKLREE